MSFIGIDFGASFVKGAVLDVEAGRIAHVTRAPFPGFLTGLPSGYREVDPGEITRSFQEVLARLLEADPDPDGLVTCSQMHGFLFVDERGRPLSNYHSWQDQRVQEAAPKSGRSFYDTMLARLPEAEQAALGREVRAGLPASQLFWLAQQDRLPRHATACALPEFLLAQACGQPPVTEATLASGYGLFDAAAGTWHAGVLDQLGLPPTLLPGVRPVGSRCGTLRWQGHDIPCYTPIGDQQCALLGIGLAEDELSLNIATGSQVSLRAREFSSGSYQVRPYLDGGFLRTITHIPAGRSLNALVRLLTELHPSLDPEAAWDAILAKLATVQKTNLRADLSYFPGAFGSAGSLEGMQEENLNVGSVFLAALENMATRYWLAAQRLSQQNAWRGVVLSGGLAQKITRLQELLQREIPGPQRVPAFAEDTLRGLLILAAYWTGSERDLARVQARLIAATGG